MNKEPIGADKGKGKGKEKASTGSRGAFADSATRAFDPVCGMSIELGAQQEHAELEGVTYYFCSPACRQQFESNPKEFVR